MDKSYKFEALIKAVDNINGAYIEFPYDVKEEFGTLGRVKVIATFDSVEYRSSLVKMKTPCHIIGITKAIREQIGKQPGDQIFVTIKIDNENKVDEIPEAFRIALIKNSEASDFFAELTSSQKNKYIHFITSAKQQKTVDNRLKKVIEMLQNKEKMK